MEVLFALCVRDAVREKDRFEARGLILDRRFIRSSFCLGQLNPIQLLGM